MKPLFIQGPSPTFRVSVLVIFSVVLMTLDHRWHYLQIVRSYLTVLVSPIYYVVDLPVETAQWIAGSFATHGQLLAENKRLRDENRVLQLRMQRFSDLSQENERLRGLFNSSRRVDEKVLVADVLAVDPDPFSRKMLINKGSQHGVYPGLPLLDAQGVLGQILHVSPYTSTIMLITDPSHALPVRVERTGVRAVAEGSGQGDLLNLVYLPSDAEIRAGDVLVTSGLGGNFPSGYPVGTVLEVKLNLGQPYAEALVRPAALLDRNQEILLVWPAPNETQEAFGPPLPPSLSPASSASSATP